MKSQILQRVQNPEAEGVLCFRMIEDISHAGYYLTGNWPRPETQPVLDTQSRPMKLTFQLTAQTVRDLQETLTRAIMIDGLLARSARAFRMLLATKLAGRVIPEASPRSSDSQAG